MSLTTIARLFTAGRSQTRGSSKSAVATLVLTACLSPAIQTAWAQIGLTRKYSFQSIDFESVQDVAARGSSDEALVAGSTRGDLFGPNAGDLDAFVIRQSFDNPLSLKVQFGTPAFDEATGVAYTAEGGAFVAGNTAGEMAGPGSYMGSSDVFVRKYDPNGNVVWTVQFGTSAQDEAMDMVSDGAGGVYVAGFTRGDLFEPNAGDFDTFLFRIDTDGTELFCRQYGTPAPDFGVAVANDRDLGVFVVGDTDGDLGGPNAGLADMHVSRFTKEGELSWSRQFGSPEWELGNAVAADGNGGVFIGGLTEGSMGGPAMGFGDGVVIRLDENGIVQFTEQFGTSADEEVRGLALDDAGGVFAVGTSRGDLFGITNRGQRDIFLKRFTHSGPTLEEIMFGTSGDDVPNRAMANISEAPYTMSIVGSSTGDLYAPNMGAEDAFLAVYGKESAVCYADCDQSTGPGILDIFDFLCFQNSFVAGETYACDCDTSTGPLVCDIFDFLCFQDAFVGGCP